MQDARYEENLAALAEELGLTVKSSDKYQALADKQRSNNRNILPPVNEALALCALVY